MNKENQSKGVWGLFIIFMIYHFFVTSNLEDEISKWKSDYSEVEHMLMQEKESIESLEDENNDLQEIVDCFRNENWSYCAYNYF